MENFDYELQDLPNLVDLPLDENKERIRCLLEEHVYAEEHMDENGLYSFPFAKAEIIWFIIMIGVSGSGKSVMLDYYLFRMREKIFAAFGVRPSEDGEPCLQAYMPRCLIHTEMNDAVLERTRNRHHILKVTYEKTGKMPPCCPSFNVLGIFDDFIHEDNKTLFSPELKALAIKGRHDKEGLIMLIQHANAIKKFIRTQADFLFFQKVDSEAKIKEIWDLYGTSIIDCENFIRLFDHYTQDYGTFIIRIKHRNNNINERFFYCRAIPREAPDKSRLLPDFKLDEGSMWTMAAFHAKESTSVFAPVDYDSQNIFSYEKTVGPQHSQVSRGRGRGRGRQGSSQSFPVRGRSGMTAAAVPIKLNIH